jgi:hypothetical protein
VSKKETGRPAYEATPADRATVKNLAAVGVPHAEIAKCIGTHGISEPTLRKHFRRELDVSINEVLALAMSGLVMGLKKGEAWAVCFALKCRAGWQEINGHRFVDERGRDRAFLLADADQIVADADDEDEGR